MSDRNQILYFLAYDPKTKSLTFITETREKEMGYYMSSHWLRGVERFVYKNGKVIVTRAEGELLEMSEETVFKKGFASRLIGLKFRDLKHGSYKLSKNGDLVLVKS